MNKNTNTSNTNTLLDLLALKAHHLLYNLDHFKYISKYISK